MRKTQELFVSYLHAFTAAVLLIVGIQFIQLNNELEDTKTTSKVYFEAAVQNEKNYEDSLKETSHAQTTLGILQKTLAEHKRHLSEVRAKLAESAERENTWRIRASRSRLAEPLSPQPRVVAQAPGFAGGQRNVTMYCPTGNTTASGKTPTRGMVATSSRAIPFGTQVRIEGLGEFTVEDRIGYGSEFDIFTPNCSEATAFGRQNRRVTVLS